MYDYYNVCVDLAPSDNTQIWVRTDAAYYFTGVLKDLNIQTPILYKNGYRLQFTYRKIK